MPLNVTFIWVYLKLLTMQHEVYMRVLPDLYFFTFLHV